MLHVAHLILYAEIPTSSLSPHSAGVKSTDFCRTPNPIPQITRTHWHTLSVDPQRWSKHSSRSVHSPWECCETVNCLRNLHSSHTSSSPSSHSALFFFLGMSLCSVCHSLPHRAFTPVVGRHTLISLLFIFLSMAWAAGECRHWPVWIPLISVCHNNVSLFPQKWEKSFPHCFCLLDFL